MTRLLFEIFSEEIPARMQVNASKLLGKELTGAIQEAGLDDDIKVRTWVTPRRLVALVEGLLPRSHDLVEVKNGPKIDAPDKAIDGFMRANGLSDRAQAQIVEDPKKGRIYQVKHIVQGRAADVIVADALPVLLAKFYWPSSMRWGELSRKTSSARWIRPIRSLLCLLEEREEARVLAFTFAGATSSNLFSGHPFLGASGVTVDNIDDYFRLATENKVILSSQERQEIIAGAARDLCNSQGIQWVENAKLLSEVAGLVEYPVPMIGQYDAAFLQLPEKIIQLTIAQHQKCFVTRHASGALAPYFVLVADNITRDGGIAIVKGNEKVIHARLSDAAFFWQRDVQTPLLERLPALEAMRFHEKLGSQRDRANRIAAIAGKLAQICRAEVAQVERASLLAKCDLVTDLVGELPELQGYLGSQIAKHQNERSGVVDAIASHYLPLGPLDSLPEGETANVVALADKLDTLLCFWLIKEKPTGSKDPYALRRAAIGCLRILMGLQAADVPLPGIVAMSCEAWHHAKKFEPDATTSQKEVTSDLVRYMIERLRGLLRQWDGEGFDYDVVDAVVSRASQIPLPELLSRIRFLQARLGKGERNAPFVLAFRRVTNLLASSQEAEFLELAQLAKTSFETDQERNLVAELLKLSQKWQHCLQAGHYACAFGLLDACSERVELMMDKIVVNAENSQLRLHRQGLIACYTNFCSDFADLSRLKG